MVERHTENVGEWQRYKEGQKPEKWKNDCDARLESVLPTYKLL